MARGPAWLVIGAVSVALAGIGLVIGEPQIWFALVGLLVMLFALRMRDRPATFAGFVAAGFAYGVWLAGTIPAECSLSLNLGAFRVASTSCPRLLLPDLDHFPEWIDFAITYGGAPIAAAALGGTTARVVDRWLGGGREEVVPPPPPPPASS
jgi:hypothetical protein